MMRRVHMDPEEAVRAALDLRARAVVGMHFGTFDLADEPLDEPPRRFLAEAAPRPASANALRHAASARRARSDAFILTICRRCQRTQLQCVCC